MGRAGKAAVKRVTASVYVRYHTVHGLAPVARPLQAIYVDRTVGNVPRNNGITGHMKRPLTLTARGDAVAVAIMVGHPFIGRHSRESGRWEMPA